MTDKDQLEDLEERVERLEEAVFQQSEVEYGTNSKKMSLAEFMRGYETSNNQKKVLVIGQFLEVKEGVKTFTADDIKKAYERAKRKAPANPTDPISKNAKEGYIREVGAEGQKKQWTLTQTGVRRVENELKEENNDN